MGIAPQLLPLNQVEHFYRGGRRIAALRGGSPDGAPNRPEEWLGSMTTMTSAPGQGLSRLADGTLLRTAIEADPVGWLGAEHAARFGASTELLVKLLDAGQRLPVHFHPDRAFARRHLGLVHGKNEAWIVLHADEGAKVRLGFAETLRALDVRAMLGDSAALLGALREVEVRPGDAVLVPAGFAHSIDAGIFVLELQEPTDLSILLEGADLAVDIEAGGHLGLGFDTALEPLRCEAVTDDELDQLIVRADHKTADLLPPAAGPYFRAHRIGQSEVDAGFAIVVVLAGEGMLVAESGDRLALHRGDAAVVPHASGRWSLAGPIEAIACRPPRGED
ncbi:class I mannose-6-phosphate isomerase [Allorhizocola rhizosphaerae]|uniref:class I mannose-6-phosphate isomerase n=1 Tax=Allorhizocola rhizosphaerae TaxID=1872709 RepID=UPI000E3D6C65|nr:class I mannose-6-phosphate isomerase [Allorhizocola rhizosphaerae]